MKLFSCEHCGQTVYFENSRCVSCGEALGYVPESASMIVLGDAPAAVASTNTTASITATPELPPHHRCRNGREHDACNWLVPTADHDYCASCELSEIIPDLSDAHNDQAWRRIEAAKRRLLYTLFALKLPVTRKSPGAPDGLAFRFLAGTDDAPVMTGHADGVITLNIAEADFAFRENMREKMGEGYRTVLGHLRHEIGHYYWDRLVRDGGQLDAFRAVFGDERASYEAALERHYGAGPPADWGERFISAYASMHPWEDWAETWAHYLHMVDTLETAKSHGLTVRAPAAQRPGEKIATDRLAFFDFDSLTTGWTAVTLALNSLNRSMGMKDAYPFVITAPVLEKLRFVHELVRGGAEQGANRALQPAA
ncbi:MAG TPA: putative zinc-binding metallopeptidase [Steroidobacteraceae bacterium]|nr:putative zinc-binding metallopeptidase [Steroidobacteraceae bacterium]